MCIKDIAEYLDVLGIKYEFKGDLTEKIVGFSSLKNYKKGTITWIKNDRDSEDLRTIDLAIVSFEAQNIKPIKNIIRTNESKRAFFSILEKFYGDNQERPRIGENTFISDSVKLGGNVRVGHNCVLDGDIFVGDNTIIWNNVTIINKVDIGKGCEIQSGTVIGHDGFGYSETTDGQKKMVKHYGGVTVGDRVHIGMNIVIARGTIDDTIIEDGVKIADLTHIGHNCYIGKNSTIICSKIYGSCVLGENSYLAGTFVRNQVRIGEGAMAGIGSVVVKDIEAYSTVLGNPAKPRKNK